MQLGDFGDDNRAGINRTLHRISCMRNRDGRIVGLTCRAGRAVLGSAAMAADLVASGSSILFMVGAAPQQGILGGGPERLKVWRVEMQNPLSMPACNSHSHFQDSLTATELY